jgi:hypothetical protein
MLKRILFIVLFILIVFIFLLVMYRGELSRVFLVYYLNTRVGISSRIDEVSLSFKDVTLKESVFRIEKAVIAIDEARLMFDFRYPFRPAIGGLFLKGASLNIEDLEAARTAARNLPVWTGVSDSAPRPSTGESRFWLNAENIEFDVAMPDDLSFKGRFSFEGTFKAGALSRLDEFSLSACRIDGKDWLAKVRIDTLAPGEFALGIDEVKVKDRGFGDISLPFRYSYPKFLFEKTELAFLGAGSFFAGAIDIGRYDDICFQLTFANSFFDNIVILSGQEENVSLGGAFDGRLSFCVEGGRLRGLRGEFLNDSGGIVNIKKESALDFLKRYLDKPSHEALVDNFKNYAYNKGNLAVSTEGSTLSVNLKFSSEKFGERNIEINLHNVLGGVK